MALVGLRSKTPLSTGRFVTLLLALSLVGAVPAQTTSPDTDAPKQTDPPKEVPPKKVPPKKVPKVFQPIDDDPKLPRVLLIGDSISIGYTLNVRDLLNGQANVHRPPMNCGPTTRGLKHLDAWLGDGRWDVIHFNWGLHDLKYMGPGGENAANPAAKGSARQVDPKQYEANLETLVSRLKKTKANLIWCSTTPVPAGAKGRMVGDALKYNAIAARIAIKQKIAIDDLYAFAKLRLVEIQHPADVHFTAKGSKQLAALVAASILKQLKQRSVKK